MNILVCVKQVCDDAETLVIDESSLRAEYGKHTVFRMNRYDEYTVEEALRIRERFENTVVEALSVGPQRVEKTVRRALEMGADHGIHVATQGDEYLFPFERASLIAEAVRSRGYDLILTGVMAEDDMECQVGGLLAEMLGYACATGVIAEKISEETGEILVEREIEGGRREVLTLRFPAILTIQSGINTPRYPALSHVLRARAGKLECIDADSLSVPHVHKTRLRLTYPEEGIRGEIIEGTPSQKAERLLDILHGHSLL